MNALRRLLHFTALLGLAALGARAVAQTQSYVTKTKTINAAVLLLDSDRQGTQVYGQTAAPYAFYNLDGAKRIKPIGWTFRNPFSPGAVTAEIRSRFAEIYQKDPANPPSYDQNTFPVPDIGSPVSKRNAAYWTVRLAQLSETQIADYDVLLVAPRYLLSLTPTERERLRRFVDGGGVLWIDTYGVAGPGGVDPSNNLPYALSASNVGAAGAVRNASSSLIDGPKHVTDGDLSFLSNDSGFTVQAVTNSNTNLTAAFAEFARYRPVVVDSGNRTVVGEARLGDGAVVVTARGVAEMLSQGTAGSYQASVPGASNIGYAAQDRNPELYAQQQAAARLAVNIVALGGEYTQPGGGGHNAHSASADPGSPVLSRFTAEGVTTPYGPGGIINGAPTGTPVSYKGYLIATVGNRVVVFDAVPGRDLDGDGDPDDGISNSSGNTVDTFRDVSVGKPLDVVWVSKPIGTVLSAPVVANVPEAADTMRGGDSYAEKILVTDEKGILHIFPLVTFSSGNFRVVAGPIGEIAGGIISPPKAMSITAPPNENGYPLAPTVYDNLAYIANTENGVGQVWTVNLANSTRLTNVWGVGGDNSAGNPLPQFTAPPTVGYIPASDSPGGADRVLYGPGVFGNNSQPGFVSLWLGAKGETPATVTASAGTLTLVTHAGATSQLPIYIPLPSTTDPVLNGLAPHLTILKDGVPVSASDYSSYVTSGPTNSNGTLTYNVVGTLDDAAISAQNLTFLVDYTIDWSGGPAANGQVERGRILLPVLKTPTQDVTRRILGPIALTTRGTLHMIEGGPPPPPPPAIPPPAGADSYFAIREDAGLRGQFRVVSRFTLYNSYTQTFGGSPSGTLVPAVLEDADAVQNFFPTALRNSTAFNTFRQFRFVGGVAVRNGIVFAPIAATRLGGLIPMAMVAAFRAEPETAELRLGTDAGAAPRIIQTDWARSYPGAVIATPTQSSLSGNQLTVDADNGVVRIENLATTVRGEITDCISESQPIGVGTGTLSSYTFRQPDAVGDRWSPLLWFGLWNGGTPTGAPLVAGNSLFLPAQSVLPDILDGLPQSKWTNAGLIWSVDADAPTTGSYAVPLPNRPWIVQQVQLSGTPGPDFASPYFRMPQNRGVQSPADFVLRLKQTVLGSSSTVLGLGGGEGVVAAWSDKGVYGLSRADFTVCDEGRLLRIDSAGNPVASAFGGRFSGIGNGGSVANTRTLVRPVKAYPVGTNETLVVDAGANRIMRLDDDGTVLRSLDRIVVDPAYKPANYRAGEPLTFKDPRDVATWEGYVSLGANPVVSNQQTLEYWVHYLVADSGNGRLVELVDRFNANPNTGAVGAPITLQTADAESGVVYNGVQNAQVGVLVWQSPSLERTSAIGDNYNSVSRVLIGAAGNLRYVFVSGVSRTRPTLSAAGLDAPDAPGGKGAPSGGGGGAVVVFDPIGGTRVFDRFQRPDLTNVQLFQPSAANALVGTFSTTTRANTPAQVARPFTGLQAVSAITSLFGNPSQACARVMVTDADAVYEFNLDARLLGDSTKDPTDGGTGHGTIFPDWMIDEAAFTALRYSRDNSGTVTLGANPLFFRPTYARRLESGEVLLVNGYRGLMRDGLTAYTGEVTLLDGLSNDRSGYSLQATRTDGTQVFNLGFDAGSLHFELPPLTGIRGLVSPVFADRR